MINKIRNLPCWQAEITAIEPLASISGGSLIVKLTDNKCFVVRPQTKLQTRLGSSRYNEYLFLKCSENSTLSLPKVYYVDEDFLILHWLDGQPIQTWHTKNLQQFANYLINLQNLNITLPILNLKKRCLYLAAQLNLELDSTIYFPTPQNYVVAHHDLHPQNIILPKQNTLALIDWEYVALSDPALEIAMFLQCNDLNKSLTDYFLQSYLSRTTLFKNEAQLRNQINAYIHPINYLNELWEKVYKTYKKEKNYVDTFIGFRQWNTTTRRSRNVRTSAGGGCYSF